MNAPSIIPPATADVLGWLLLHLLWQGILVAFAVRGVLRLLENGSADLRYAVCLGGMLLVLVLPIVTFHFLSQPSDDVSLAATADPTRGDAETSKAGSEPAPFVIPTQVASRLAPAVATMTSVVTEGLPWLVLCWAGGMAVLSLRLLLSWIAVRRMRTRCVCPVSEEWHMRFEVLKRRLGVAKPVHLLNSARVDAPVVTGGRSPIVLVPSDMLAKLAVPRAEAVLAHELAHVRREDFAVNFFQRIAEAVLFYNPAVWWISRRIRIEREFCCDDLATAACGSTVQYARALIELEGDRGDRRSAPYLSAALYDGSLPDRIRRLVEAPAERSSVSAASVTGVLLPLLLLSLTAAVRVPSVDSGHSGPVSSSTSGDPRDEERAVSESTRSEEPASPLDLVVPSRLYDGDEIELILREPGYVEVRVYDLTGASKATFLEARLEEGSHRIPAWLQDLVEGPYLIGARLDDHRRVHLVRLVR